MTKLTNYWRTLTYSKKFNFLFYFIFSLFVLFVVATNFIFIRGLSKQEYKNNQDNILTIADTIDKEFVSLEFFTYKVIDNAHIQSLLARLNLGNLPFQEEVQLKTKLRDEVYTLSSYEKNVNSFYLFDAEKENLESNLFSSIIFFDGLTSTDMINQLGNQPQKGKWFLSEDGTRAVLARNIFSTDTLDLLGTIIVSLDTSFIINTIRNTSLYSSDDYFIISYEEKNYPLEKDLPKIVKDFIENTVFVNNSIETIGHTDYFIASGSFNDGKMNISGMLPKNKVLQNIILLETIILSLFFLLVVSMIALSQHFIRSLVSPINQLAKKMSSFDKDKNDFQTLIEEKDSTMSERPDEIGALYSNFDALITEINQLIEENYQSKILYQEIQFRALQSQLDPHFLYNTLDSINWLAVNQEAMEISDMVTSLATLFRRKLSNTNPLHTIAEEIEIIDAYLMIQKFRFGERLCFSYHIEEKMTDFVIPRLIIQPLIENSLKYGLEKMNQPCSVSLTIIPLDEKHISISVLDNGPGFLNSQHDKRKSSGVGIKNIRERIKLYYGKKAELNISSVAYQETIVSILLPAEFTEV